MKSHRPIFRALFSVLLFIFLSASQALAQGSLTPSAAPAPTMKTLDQVAPGTPIDALPFTIDEPGYYYLTGDLDASGGNLIIQADDVTVDLKGFRIYDTPNGVTINYARVTLTNGTITGMPQILVNASSSVQATLRDLALNSQDGSSTGAAVYTGDQTLIDDCVISSQTRGIVVSESPFSANMVATISNCRVDANNRAIELKSNVFVNGSTFTHEQDELIYVDAFNPNKTTMVFRDCDFITSDSSQYMIQYDAQESTLKFEGCTFSHYSTNHFLQAHGDPSSSMILFESSQLDGYTNGHSVPVQTDIPIRFTGCTIRGFFFDARSDLYFENSSLSSFDSINFHQNLTFSNSTIQKHGGTVFEYVGSQPHFHKLTITDSEITILEDTDSIEIIRADCNICLKDTRLETAFEAVNMTGNMASFQMYDCDVSGILNIQSDHINITDTSINGMSTLQSSSSVTLKNVITEEMSDLSLGAQTIIDLEDCTFGSNVIITGSTQTLIVEDCTLDNLDASATKFSIKNNFINATLTLGGSGRIEGNDIQNYSYTGGTPIMRDNILRGSGMAGPAGFRAPIIFTYETGIDPNTEHPAANYTLP